MDVVFRVNVRATLCCSLPPDLRASSPPCREVQADTIIFMPFKDDKGEVVDDTDSRLITACRMITVLRKVMQALLSALLSGPLVRFPFSSRALC